VTDDDSVDSGDISEIEDEGDDDNPKKKSEEYEDPDEPQKKSIFDKLLGKGKEEMPSELLNVEMDRPAFDSMKREGEDSTSTSLRKMRPRSVTVPYSRFKKDRFYDWPPDPTFSKATPQVFD
jgi:hypothetical protein